MGLKPTIIEGMNVKQLQEAVRQLDVSANCCRETQSLAAGLGESRRATAEALVEFLSKKEVKRLCDCEESVPMVGRRS